MSDRQQSNQMTGREPVEVQAEQHAGPPPEALPPTPLFLRDGNEGKKGNAQDEKDEAPE